ncbi:cysteine hydrolase family protein [Psychroflexus sp. MES1-P1E]|uniref:cysteine hydrolase family protein n=1 Tax=Psychroflexus sp. MES1-P1E TaxID=2058320 RepID=UPI000C79584C|nr:cysteine hydrolase family protein [Psychroflexus sp. MES1-P1E]PKG44120.1 cysteine hydrolase [Psychroflexus sp. MES1-P1E]
MSLKEQNATLILIDIQKGFDEEKYWGGNRNNKDAEEKSSKILKKWRELNLPIFHIVHSSQNPISRLHESHPGFEIKDEVKPIDGEPVIKKSVNNAFIGTDLKERLDSQEINKLVIIGLTTNHCISTTTRMAGNFGFNTLLISDATATFDRIGINGELFDSEIIHQTTLANLHDEFAQVIDTEKLFKLV